MGPDGELKGEKLWTYKYFAPELLKRENYSKSVDFWAVGITLIEIIGIKKEPYVGRSQKIILEKMRTEEAFRLTNEDLPTGWSK